MARLSGKVVIITGGTGGIGVAAGALFAQEIAKVPLVDLDEAAWQQAVATIDHVNVSYMVADVRPLPAFNSPAQATEFYLYQRPFGLCRGILRGFNCLERPNTTKADREFS